MFSTFWVLYLTSFVGTILEDDKEVSTLYANLMMCSIVIAIAFSPLLGVFTDRVSPQIVLPVSFLIRATAVGMFMFVDNPKKPFAYIAGSLMVTGTTAE